MKRAILLAALILLLASAAAQEIDEETGCEIFSDHVVCPMPASADGVMVNFVTGVECGSVLNENGRMEDLFCYGEAELVSDLVFTECSQYIPVVGDNVDYWNINEEYGCVRKKWLGGKNVTVIMSTELAEQCEVVEEDDWYMVTECAMEGKIYSASGVVTEEDGTKVLVAHTLEPMGGFVVDTLTAAVFAGAVLVLIFLVYQWKKKRRATG